jgi:hypothetical protein
MQFSSSQLSWVLNNRTYGMDFDDSPEFTTVTVLFQGAAEGYAAVWPVKQNQAGMHSLFT